jgi:tetratricopeptide (TPR) repeat protein
MDDDLLRSAYAHQQSSNLSEAARLYGEIVCANPRNFHALCLLGMGRNDEALASYDRATALRPGQAQPWLVRGNALIALKRYKEALACYDRALALKPNCLEALVNCAIAFNALRRHAEALWNADAALYTRMWEWAERGLKAGSFTVEADPSGAPT